MSFLLHAHDTSFYVLCISIQFYLLFFVHTSSLSLSSSQSTTSYVYIHSLLHWKTRRIVHTTKQCESECQPASHQTWTLCVYLTINFDIHLSLLMVRTMKNALRASSTYFSLAKHLSNRRWSVYYKATQLNTYPDRLYRSPWRQMLMKFNKGLHLLWSLEFAYPIVFPWYTVYYLPTYYIWL